MRKLSGLLKISNNSWIKEILGLFEPLLHLIALDDEFYNLKEIEFGNIISNQKKFLVHPFHKWLARLLKKVIILDSERVYDTIRELFLNGFVLQSPNCLTDCRDNHACCHGNYTVNSIDYERIISQSLIDPTLFLRFHDKRKLKLATSKNKQKYCIALDLSTKKCLIHHYKPPTCCKYPLISNIHDWSEELMAWTGFCAHSDVLWVTRVHPVIMNSCRDLWVSSHLLWDSEQNLFYRIRGSITPQIKEMISIMLSIKQSTWPYKDQLVKRILLESYSEASVQKAFDLMK